MKRNTRQGSRTSDWTAWRRSSGTGSSPGAERSDTEDPPVLRERDGTDDPETSGPQHGRDSPDGVLGDGRLVVLQHRLPAASRLVVGEEALRIDARGPPHDLDDFFRPADVDALGEEGAIEREVRRLEGSLALQTNALRCVQSRQAPGRVVVAVPHSVLDGRIAREVLAPRPG